MDVPDVLNLLDLASGADQHPVPALGAVLEQVTDPEPRHVLPDQWYMVLAGELIIDLPYGDFRILRANDLLVFDEAVDVTLTPVEDVTLLRAALD
ncbi:MAG: hypothetical protein AAF267_07625 [Deinococcota bacterium]